MLQTKKGGCGKGGKGGCGKGGKGGKGGYPSPVPTPAPTPAVPTPNTGFWCKAAWCSNGSVCCETSAYGLCGSPGSTCCVSPGGVINLCAPGSYCDHDNGHCYA